MIKILILKEIQRSIGSLRFMLILLLTTVLFTVSGILFVNRHNERLSDYQAQSIENTEALREAAASLSELAGHEQDLLRRPSITELFASGEEKHIPDKVSMSAFRYGGYENIDRLNYKLNPYDDFDWVFVIGLIMSFAALILTFDRISGERESGVLRLQCANTVSRFEIFAANYISSLILLFIALAAGLVLNLLIVSIGLATPVILDYPLQIALFLFLSFLYLSVFLLTGLFISSRVKKSSSGLAISLLIWTMTAVFIPAGGSMLGQKIHKVPSSYEHRVRADAAWQSIWQNVEVKEARGFWGGKNFPYFKERAELVNTLDENNNMLKNERFLQLYGQVTTAQHFTRISPYSLFRYAGEAVAGTGLNGFVSFYHQGRMHRVQFRNFVNEKDAADPESVHYICSWHPQGTSEAPVFPDEVPRFEYSEPDIAETVRKAGLDLLLLIGFNLAAALAAVLSFMRYDVR